MEAKVNIIEVASELAKERMLDDYQLDNTCDREQAEKSTIIWNKDKTESSYTKESQSSFDFWYDHYFSLITDLVL